MKQRKRLAYVLKRFPRLSETFIVNEILELERQGVEVEIFSILKPVENIQHEIVKLLRARVTYLPKDKEFRALAGNSERGLAMFRGAWVASQAEARGAVHLHAHFATAAATVAMAASRVSGIPFSFTAHAKDIYHQDVDPADLAAKIEQARFTVTVSDFNRRYLAGVMRAQGKKGTIVRLYNGVDLNRLRPAAGPSEPDLLLGVGRLVDKKGFDVLVDACGLLKDRGTAFRLMIIGEGEERPRLEERIASRSLEKSVSLLGARPQDEVLDWMRRAAVFVLPCQVSSNGDRDGLPTVLLEAMALGTPVISTRVAGIPEIVAHGKSGLLVPPRRPEVLARAIESLLRSESKRNALASRARLSVEQKFDLSQNGRTLNAIFFRQGEIHASRARDNVRTALPSSGLR